MNMNRPSLDKEKRTCRAIDCERQFWVNSHKSRQIYCSGSCSAREAKLRITKVSAAEASQ